jgi:hypothetical protein
MVPELKICISVPELAMELVGRVRFNSHCIVSSRRQGVSLVSSFAAALAFD